MIGLPDGFPYSLYANVRPSRSVSSWYGEFDNWFQSFQSTQNFSQAQMLMATRIVRQAVDDLESQLVIEPWRLEAVGGEHDLKTTPAPRFRLRDLQKATPDPLPAILLIDPDLTDLAAAAPCMSAEAGDHLTPDIATENSDTQGVDNPGGLGVELVEAILEKVNLGWRRIRSHDQLWVCHCLLRFPDYLANTEISGEGRAILASAGLVRFISLVADAARPARGAAYRA
jgi:hypothetical protein